MSQAQIGLSTNNLTQRPLDHYGSCYRKLDPEEVAARTGLQFNREGSSFGLVLMGSPCHAAYPDYSLSDESGEPVASAYESILILRFLCEGRFVSATGTELTYKELPWGITYDTNFEHRVKRRLLREFAKDLALFAQLMETNKGLKAQPLEKCDCGYRFEFMGGLPVSIRFWAADEEFPASVQVLFDESFQFAFSAEDVAVVGDTIINRLIGMRAQALP
ncbi:MAG: DUF3786 domain-containing protein [Coriobacteriales bacterium]|jgi:hypothetical protein|nr:DUF3786 domain-containing protein [Coriobacteriales bacterium]